MLPIDYDALIQTLQARRSDMSKTNRHIADYLCRYPNEVAVLAIGGVADKLGIHPSSVVRFAQFLGFRGFKELQSLFHDRISQSTPSFGTRLREASERFSHNHGFAPLQAVVSYEIAALEEMLASLEPARLALAARYVATAPTIYLMSDDCGSAVIEQLHLQLALKGRRTITLSGANRLSTMTARTITSDDLLLCLILRREGPEVEQILRDCRAQGATILGFTNSALSTCGAVADVHITLPNGVAGREKPVMAALCVLQSLVQELPNAASLFSPEMV